ncbi:MAG: hypothetical protein HY581_09950 [Nitrospirae bacterium]|nr:hypothetical protein [Nitrospirota bacterium]
MNRRASLTGKAVLASMTALLMSFLSYSALGVTYQKVLLEEDTIRIQTALGEPVLDITLVENTEQCLGECYAILRVKPYTDLNLPETPTAIDNIHFKTASDHRGLKSNAFEILREEQVTVTVPVFETRQVACPKGNGTVFGICQETVQKGSREEQRTTFRWEPFSFWGEHLPAGRDYIIKLRGQKVPTLGPNNVDWLLTLQGIPLTEWAWWNSSWLYRRQIRVTNNNESAILNSGYSINLTFNHSGLADSGKSLANGRDVRVVFNDTIELDRFAFTTFNSSQNTTLFFRTQSPLGPMATSLDYFLYYGNPSAEPPPENKSRVFNFSDDFELYSLGDLNGQGLWSGPTNAIFVNDTQPFEGNKSALSTSRSGSQAPVQHPLGNFTTGVLHAKLYIQGDNVGSDLFLIQGGSYPVHMEFNRDEPSTLNQILWYVNNGASTISLGEYTPGAWFDLAVFFNRSSSDVYVGGELRQRGLTNNVLITGGITAGGPGMHHLGNEDDTDRTYRDIFLMRGLLIPDPSAILGPEDQGSGTLTVQDVIPTQVVKNVDLVKGKRTLVRTVLNFNPGTNQSQQYAVVKVFLQDQGLVAQNLSYPLNSGINNVDLFFQPQPEEQNIQLTAEVSASIPSFSPINITTLVNVTRTRQLNLTYVPLFGPQNFNLTINKTVEFLNRTYPVSDDGILASSYEGLLEQLGALTNGTACIINYLAQKNIILSSDITKTSFERLIIVLPQNWVQNLNSPDF